MYADLSANFYRPYSFWEQLGKASAHDIAEGTKLPIVDPVAIEAIIERDSLTLLGIS